jgi:hypothetical protein
MAALVLGSHFIVLLSIGMCNDGRFPLPPLPLPEGHGANNDAVLFLVRQYIIEGVQDLLQELLSHVTMFCKELITFMEGASESWQLITKEKYMTILTAMISICDREPVKFLRLIYPQIYKGVQKICPCCQW